MLKLPQATLLSRLTYGSIVLFALQTLLLWIVSPQAHPYVATAILMYGALLVAFLAGIQWGLIMKSEAQGGNAAILWATGLALLAWVATLMPPFAGLPLLGLVLVAGYLLDRKAWPAHGLGDWMTLRFRFTALVTLCCLLGAAAT